MVIVIFAIDQGAVTYRLIISLETVSLEFCPALFTNAELVVVASPVVIGWTFWTRRAGG
jgi:hypothetical protein